LLQFSQSARLASVLAVPGGINIARIKSGEMTMSDLGRLFRLSLAAPKPLENFTTEALAIAIGHDDRPMRHALRAVDPSYEEEDGRAALAPFDFASADFGTVTAKTQTTLWPGPELTLGYLDLILDCIDAQQRRSTIWVEVKVDAGESGVQIANYKRHAALRSPSPVVITLGRMRISRSAPALKWSAVVDAIASVPNAHHAWLSLRAFLGDERIASPTIPKEPVGNAGAHIDIIVKVNGLLRSLWPGTSLIWTDKRLRGMLQAAFDERRDLVASGGPVRYGLMPGSEGWEWCLAVTAKNYENVRLEPWQIRQDAEVGGLPQDWLRHTDRPEVLERRAALKELKFHDEIMEWFNTGLEQLRGANILGHYFEVLAARQSKAVLRLQHVAATVQTAIHENDAPKVKVDSTGDPLIELA
jgi:hypothetical protein